MLRFWKLYFHGVTQLHSYAVSFTIGEVLCLTLKNVESKTTF